MIRLQDNAMRLLEIAVENGITADNHVQKDISEELSGMIEEAKHAFNQDRPQNDKMNFVGLTKKVRQVEAELKTNKWANKIVASFVVEDFRGSLPQTFLDRFQLRKVPLTVTKTKGIDFEYPTVKDLLFCPSDIFELRELHQIEWQLSTNGSLRMPRLTFLGDDTEGQIQTPINLKDPTEGHLNVYGRKVTIPDDGVKSVIVRSTNNWVRQIMIVSNQNHRICDI